MESGNFITSLTPTDTLIPLGDSVQIDMELSHQGVDIVWSPRYFLNCWNCEDPVVTPGFSTDYSVLVTDTTTGCIDTASVSIEVDETLEFFVPNTFTPNGDGLNDVLQAYGNGVTRFKMEVFNRWGEKIFETNDINEGWDGTFKGKDVPPGVYVYTVTAAFGNYTTLPPNHPYKKGSVTVIR
jgi:gliding motility-associated-like protein